MFGDIKKSENYDIDFATPPPSEKKLRFDSFTPNYK